MLRKTTITTTRPIVHMSQQHLLVFVTVLWTLLSVTTLVVAQNNNNSNTTTTTPVRVPPECYTTFRELLIDLEAKDPFAFQTFVVCPGTVIEVGQQVAPGEYINGDPPLNMRQFTKVYCGTDGSSMNNCTVRGGAIQLIVQTTSWNDEAKKRMEVKGFTFEAAVEYSVLTVFQEGDLLIEDCIFRHHVRGGILSAAVSNLLQPEVTFRSCVFDHNHIGSTNSMFIPEGGAKLIITDSVFSNNIYVSDTVLTTSAIRVHDNLLMVTLLTLQNNCFFGNNFENNGLVSVDLAASLVDVRNNFGTMDDANLQCQFIYVVETDTCIDFDATTCPIAGVETPPVREVPAQGKPSAASMRAVWSPMLQRQQQSQERPAIIVVATAVVIMMAVVLQHLM